jgi:hypothetical protein
MEGVNVMAGCVMDVKDWVDRRATGVKGGKDPRED